MSRLLVFGTANDGPSEITVVNNLEKARKLYGQRIYERILVSETDTSVLLSDVPWNGFVQVAQETSSGLVGYPLFSPEEDAPIVSGWTIDPTETLINPSKTFYFQPTGTSGSLVFGYRSTPSNSSLVDQIEQVIQSGFNGEIHAQRVGGVKANISLGGLLLTAKYAGSIYNQTSGNITYTGSSGTLYINNPPGFSWPQIIQYTDTSDLIKQATELYQLGRLAVSLSVTGSSQIPSGSFILSGGHNTDNEEGLDVNQSILDLVGTTEFEGFRVLCLSGFDSPKLFETTAVNLSRSTYPSLAVLADNIHGLESSGAVLTSASGAGYVQIAVVSQEAYIPFPSGEELLNIGPSYAALLASPMESNRNGLTWSKVPYQRFFPIYSQEELSQLSSYGRVAINRSIKFGPVISDAVLSHGTRKAGFWKIYQEICDQINEGMRPFIGAPPISDFTTRVNQLIQGTPGVTSISATTNFSRIDRVLFIDVFFSPIGELETISVRLSIKL
jgi:hypothetical protein